MNEILNCIKEIVLGAVVIMTIILVIKTIKLAVLNKTTRTIIRLLAIFSLIAFGISLYLRWQ